MRAAAKPETCGEPSWIGVDGLVAGYRQRHPNLFSAHLRLPGTRGTAGTAAAHPVA